MTERGQAAQRPARVPLPRRSRMRWAAAAAVVVCWLVLLDVTGSIIAATMLLAFLAGLGVAGVLILRSLGISRDHPWIRQLGARPWRDGQEVLQLALRHLPEVFVVTPSRSLLAPDVVEMRLNPDDLDSLTERMDPGLIAESAAEVYQEQVAAHGARLAGTSPVAMRLIPDPSVPAGRYRLRQGQPVDFGAQPGFQFAYAGAQALGGQYPAAPPPGAPYAAAPYAAAPYAATPSPAAPYPAAQPPAAAYQAGAYPVVHYPAAEHPDTERPAAEHPGAERRAAPAPGAQLHAVDATNPSAGGPGTAPAGPAAPTGPRRVPDSPYPGFVGHDGNTRAQQAPGQPAAAGMATVIELSRSPVPVLRLVTGGSVAETRVSGARAGRGAVELALPDVPTVSREHARFTFSDGHWWIANLGRNGLTLNGAALVGEQPLSDGDSIRWGMRSDALLSRVEIG
jgi:FHA domain